MKLWLFFGNSVNENHFINRCRQQKSAFFSGENTSLTSVLGFILINASNLWQNACTYTFTMIIFAKAIDIKIKCDVNKQFYAI